MDGSEVLVIPSARNRQQYTVPIRGARNSAGRAVASVNRLKASANTGLDLSQSVQLGQAVLASA